MNSDNLIYLTDESYLNITFAKKYAELIFIDSNSIEHTICLYSVEDGKLIENIINDRKVIVDKELELGDEVNLLFQANNVVKSLLLI